MNWFRGRAGGILRMLMGRPCCLRQTVRALNGILKEDSIPLDVAMAADVDALIHTCENRIGIGCGGGSGTSGEAQVLHMLRQLVPGCLTLFDVGANAGDYARTALAALDGRKVFLHCFEPARETFAALSASLAAVTACENVSLQLNNCALGSEDGEATLYSDSPLSGLASLTKRRLDHFSLYMGQSERISMTTLDAYCAQHRIEHIHFCKVDVEGHELDVFRGAKKMLAAGAVDVLQFEFGGCNIDTRIFFQDYWYFLKPYGYAFYRLMPRGCYPIQAYAEYLEKFRTTNFVASQLPLPCASAHTL